MNSTLSDDFITLYYQPLADGRGTVVGFGALMHWRHQQRDMVDPGAFLPIFESSGLIVPLSRWALRQACLDAARWKHRLRVSVNLSPVQFLMDDLCDLVRRVLAETGLSPDRLELDVSEATLESDPAGALVVLRSLCSQGVRIAIDEAGDGVTLPFLLQDYPFSTIKIARSVVTEIECSATARSIVHFITLVGRSMHLPVVASGVETIGQLAYLQEQGCDLIQGFLVGRPAPIDSFAMVTGDTANGVPRGAISIPWPADAPPAYGDESRPMVRL